MTSFEEDRSDFLRAVIPLMQCDKLKAINKNDILREWMAIATTHPFCRRRFSWSATDLNSPEKDDDRGLHGTFEFFTDFHYIACDRENADSDCLSGIRCFPIGEEEINHVWMHIDSQYFGFLHEDDARMSDDIDAEVLGRATDSSRTLEEFVAILKPELLHAVLRDSNNASRYLGIEADDLCVRYYSGIVEKGEPWDEAERRFTSNEKAQEFFYSFIDETAKRTQLTVLDCQRGIKNNLDVRLNM